MYCCVGLCRLGQRFSFVEYVVGGSVVKSLVRPLFVEVAQVVVNSLPGLAHRLVRASVDFFLLEAAPEAFHVHIVEEALAVHRDAHAVLLERTGERFGGKLRSLIGVEDLWRAVADNGFFHRFDAKGDVHRVREPMGERLAAMPVDYGHKIVKRQ